MQSVESVGDMSRGIRLTKAERAWLSDALGNVAWGGKGEKLSKAILDKVAASEESPKGVDIVPIEEALVAAARGKVIALEGGHARASVQAKAVAATPETATMVGAWMARQGWLTGPMTVLDVLNKWYMWLPKARATEPPPALSPGLGADADTRPGPGTPGKPPTGGRSTPGFR
jgi:hypothetical protein